MSAESKECASFVQSKRQGNYRVGMILGSGLSTLVDEMEEAVGISYSDLPGFPNLTVSSHSSELVTGKIGNHEIAILSGRAHYYENGDPSIMRNPIETLKELGCKILLLTNAAGSLREEVGPGSLMLITDHINLSGANPLIGEHDEKRFVDLTDAYDMELRNKFHMAATKSKINLAEGVYGWWSGPSFETPAEIRMARTIGIDAAGMSTVPEVLLARFLGLRVCAISTITNLAAGMQSNVSHDETKAMGLKTAGKLRKLIEQFLTDL